MKNYRVTLLVPQSRLVEAVSIEGADRLAKKLRTAVTERLGPGPGPILLSVKEVTDDEPTPSEPNSAAVG